MPGGNGTGPMGMGSMTGRATGFCAGYGMPGFTNGFGRNFSGQGFTRGGHRRFRYKRFFTEQRFIGFMNPYAGYQRRDLVYKSASMDKKTKIKMLTADAANLENALKQTQEHLAKLQV